MNKKIVIILLFFLGFQVTQGQEIVIVTGTKALTSMTKAELQAIYQEKIYEINGSRVSFLDHERNTQLYKDFIKKFFNMDADQMVQYWLKEKLETGKKQPKYMSDAFLPRALTAIKGSISYYYKNNVPENLSIIQISDE